MTDELKQKAENFIIDRYKLNECYREDNAETREYMRMDVHSQYEKEYQLYLDATDELQKENAELKLKLEALEGQTPWKDIKDKSELIKENEELKAQLESERDLPAIAYMQGAEKQKKKDEEELKKWKDEWQEQVQKATDEGYARTLQTMQLTKAKELLKDITSSYGSTEVSEAQLYLKIKKAEIFLKNSEVEK